MPKIAIRRPAPPPPKTLRELIPNSLVILDQDGTDEELVYILLDTTQGLPNVSNTQDYCTVLHLATRVLTSLPHTTEADLLEPGVEVVLAN